MSLCERSEAGRRISSLRSQNQRWITLLSLAEAEQKDLHSLDVRQALH